MIRPLLLLLLCLVVVPSEAQVPPPPSDRLYRNADPAARVFFPQLDTPRGRARLDRHLLSQGTDSRAWAARGYLHALEGDQRAALSDFATALEHAGDSRVRVRNVSWSEGWARLNLGQIPEAVKAWTHAWELHGGAPYWLPYSFALLAEVSGERHTALAWYGVAVHSQPGRWDSGARLARTTAHWRPGERAAMEALFVAWDAKQKRDGES